jgi:chromosome segregation protein
MYLKQIEIIGFKSFAKKTQIDFTGNITAVVGPNGSGKSNVADAIKWVLGEQRVKYLRGDKMEDVIFNGTVEKRPLGYAQVSLLIDNTNKILPIEYDEINITRRLFRSGESQYFINKTLCRLKDIQQLFMDTGLGREGYSLIGQGQIQDIIDGSPQSRRLLIEEAVGIVKYKTKKADAQRKLEKTQLNLDRIEDIICELQKRIDPLKRQVEKAKKYLSLRDELKEKELNIFAHKIEEYAAELKKYTIDKEILENDFILLEKSFSIAEKSSIDLKNLIADYDLQLNEINEAIYEFSTTNESIKTKWEVSKVKYEQNIAYIQSLNKENIKLADNIGILSQQKIEIENALYSMKEEYEILKDNLEIQKLKVQTSFEMQDNFINRESEYKNLEYILCQHYENIKEYEQKLQDIQREIAQCEESLHTKQTELNLEQTEYKNIRAGVNTYVKENEHNERMLNDLLQKIKVLQSQLSMLKANEDDMQGYGYAVKKMLQARKNNEELGKSVHGVIAELIHIDNKYIKAITAALGGAFRYIAVDNEKSASECIRVLNKNKWGRATFMPISVIRSSFLSSEEKNSIKNYYIASAAELVDYDKLYDGIIKHILGRVLVTKDIPQATQLAKITKYKYKIVTLNGEVFMPGGVIVGGESKTDNIAPLKRKERIDEIKNEIESLQSEYDKYIIKTTDSKNKIAKINHEVSYLQNKINELTVQHADCNAKYNNLLATQKTVQEQITQTEKQVVETNQKKEEFLRLLNINNDIEDIKKNYKIENEKLNELNIGNIKILEKIKYSEDKLNAIKTDIDKDTNQEIRNKEKIQSLTSEVQQLEQDISAYQNDNNYYEKQRQELKERYDALLLLRNEKKEEFNQKNEDAIKLSKEKNDLKDMINRLVLKHNNIQMKTEYISSNIIEQYQIELNNAAEYKKPIENMSEYTSKAEEIKRTIKSFGNINIGALDEYREVAERYEFLTTQRDDLINAKNDIELVITDIEKNMALQFKEQFALIQKEFEASFKKLFDGGTATLVILNENDLLNTGIDISAQPPGKKLKNISMLSGGEKAMTSIALLFAILKIKPAPFCVLDEIDAALDDNNVMLFARYIHEQRKDNQLIIITHKKRTMEICDCLYGASMGSEGTTKIVSLQLTS